MSVEVKRGQKLCKSCSKINGVRSFECKHCGEPFEMKKGRKTPKKKRVDDYTTLKKGDVIRVIGGSGPYYESIDGERQYLTDRGKYLVESIDNNGIHSYGSTGYNYLYMGKKCRSHLLDRIIKEPHKIVLLRGLSQLNQVSPKGRRSRIVG